MQTPTKYPIIVRKLSVNLASTNLTPGGNTTNPPGLETKYNHDLDVAEPFLVAYTPIRDALRDQRLLERFDFFDTIAKEHKRSFESLGLWSLVLGVVPLVVAALRMAVGEPAFSRVTEIGVIGEVSGVASVCIALWTRRCRHRVLWCLSCYWRERLRQWHFQKFLDGGLIGLLVKDRPAYDRELDRRWAELEQNFHDGYGMMVEFMRYASRGSDFFHPVTEYADHQTANQVFSALQTLRFEHQLRYSRRKIEPEGEQAGFSLEERTTLSETVASVTLAGAIVMSVLALVVSGTQVLALTSWLSWEPIAMTRSIGGIALLLAVASAGSRAYRAGFTLPDESESYEEYCDRVRELKAVFTSMPNDTEKLSELEQLEQEAAAELRRFLRMKTRATFVS